MKEKRFSSGTPSKNKISNFGDYFSLYQILYTTLSLSQFEGKRKNRKEERHLCPWTIQFIIYIWHFESVSLCIVKDSCILMLPRGLSCSLQFCYEFVVSHFLFSFYSPYVIFLKIVLWIPLKYHTGNRSCRLLQYNIITSQPRGPYLPLSRGRKESDLVGVWIAWNLVPLASGGQSSPKLIPHIICPFLYAWEKISERGLIL